MKRVRAPNVTAARRKASVTLVDEPPPRRRRRNQYVDWDAVESEVKRNPGKWYRVQHTYRTDDNARTTCHTVARRRGLEVRVYRDDDLRDAEGRAAVFCRYPVIDD